MPKLDDVALDALRSLDARTSTAPLWFRRR